MRTRVLALLLCCAAAGCASAPSKLDAKEVPAAITHAEQELAAGRTESALDWMRAATAAKDLPTEQRNQVQRVLEEAATKRIEELSAPGQDPDDLAELVEIGLPRQLSVQAGLAAARAQVRNGDRMDAFRLLRKLDRKFPLHHERQAAGDLIVEIGLYLAQLHKSFLIFYSSDSQAEEVLEYAIIQHPWARRGDEAHQQLADLYESHNDLPLAIDRLQKLVLDHPDSPLRPRAQLRVPILRLKLLRSPEFDRGTLLKAEEELKRWLGTYGPDHELAHEAGLRLGDCERRLCDSDLSIARFYRTIDNVAGTRFHAERAAEEARTAGDTQREKRALELVAGLPPGPAAAVAPQGTKP